MTDSESFMPKTFFDEVVEIYADFKAEVDEGQVRDTDPEVMKFLARLSLICMTEGKADLPVVVQRLSTAMLWMLVIGREHQARGYSAPILRTRAATDIPDFIHAMFEGN